MWYATRQEGLDDPRHNKRAPCININNQVNRLLRIGFTVQLVSLTLTFIFYWAFGGSGLFSYDLGNMSEEARSDQSARNCIACLSGFYLIGSIGLLLFQALMADDACWARGYRAGSKIMRMATFFDLISSTMQFIFFLYFAKFYSTKWYQHFLEGGSEWVFFSYIRSLHAISFILYASATYLLEVYHDEGAGDLHAYINGSFFLITGIIEFIVIFFRCSSIASAFIWLSLVAVTTWGYFFEPEVNGVSPALHETELTNDVEQQVDKFARMSPYYAAGEDSSTSMQNPLTGQHSGVAHGMEAY